MTSIQLGGIEIQTKREGKRRRHIEELQEEIQQVIGRVVESYLEAALEEEVKVVLGRERYERRHKVARRITEAKCKRCGTRVGWYFSRNGHYKRELQTRWGVMQLRMPQLRCKCGGSVQVDYQTVRRRQRIWDDVESEMRERYGWGESLRAVKASLDHWLGCSLGLRTINKRVHKLAELAHIWRQTRVTQCPPVVRLDGLWVPQMIATGKQREDTRGRLREVKQGERRPLLVAQGVWPTSGRQEVLAWVLGTAEDEESWANLLNQMWDRGVQPEYGLRLLVADGGPGLTPARQLVYWNVPFQRCIFHKLRNLWRALVVPEDLSRKDARAYKRRLIRSATRIWQPTREATARERQSAWCLDYEVTQPEAVATLRRDFDDTLTFYQVQAAAAQHGQLWPATTLRTTSHIERLFRVVRRRVSQALVLHSAIGLTALAFQCFTRWAAGQVARPNSPVDWPLQLERALASPTPFS